MTFQKQTQGKYDNRKNITINRNYKTEYSKNLK